MKLLSLVVPIYNEQANIPILHRELAALFNGLPNFDFELIFVDDGSSDNSVKVIEDICGRDPKVKFIEFSRNFGKEIATSAGLHAATGDGVMMIDADLQHPINMIPEFIKKWEAGAEIVIGVRDSNNGEGTIKRLGSKFFYFLIGLISDTKIIAQGTDFRLLDRKVVDEFNRFTETNRITRGLIDWLGFKRDYIHFTASARQNGTAAYNTWKLVTLAFNSFVTHSLFPLKIAGYLGLLIILVSGPFGLFIFLEKYVFNDPWGLNFSGPAILAVIILFMMGIVLSALGLIALYIANIHMEINHRPMYVIRKKKI